MDAYRSRDCAREALGPFDRHHTALRQIGIEPDLVELDAIQPVQIDMNQRQPAAAVLVLVTSSGSIPRPAARPRTNAVLPAPRSPDTSNTVPGARSAASCAAS
jgi:hypothetical protein